MNPLGMGLVISLRDSFSQNAQRISHMAGTLDSRLGTAAASIQQSTRQIQQGAKIIGVGLATMAVPSALVASTIQTQRALGALSSVGIRDLRALEDAAERFTAVWSDYSKAEFVAAAYDIKSGISSLTDAAVGSATEMAALTAKATRATVGDMTNVFAAGYDTFRDLNRELDDTQWFGALSGALSQTVQQFRTTGPEMAHAMRNVGKLATQANRPLYEQLAVLGTLQASMPGAEAGTLYKAFMMKAAEAGKGLGLSFTDTQGRLLGITEIIGRIKNRFPDLSQAAAQVQLKEAFGSDEAVRFVLQLASGVDGLESSIQGVAAAMRGGSSTTREMAEAMNRDLGSRVTVLRQNLQNAMEALGRTILPVVLPVVRALTAIVHGMHRIITAAPLLFGGLLGIVFIVGLLITLSGALLALSGAIKIAFVVVKFLPILFGIVKASVLSTLGQLAAAFWPITLVIAAVVISVLALRAAWNNNFAGIRDRLVGVWNTVTLVVQGFRSLVQSFRDGSGTIAGDLAEQLQASGLMGTVTTLFMIYHRVRAFTVGLFGIVSSMAARAFGIIGNALQGIIAPIGSVLKAFMSIGAAFGFVGAQSSAEPFLRVGQAIGFVLGALLQAAAIVVRVVLYPVSLVLKLVALVARAFAVVTGGIVRAAVAVAKWLWWIAVPARMLVGWFVLMGRTIATVWRILSGEVSLTQGLKTIGRAALDWVLTPFRFLGEVWRSFCNGIQRGVGLMVAGFRWMGTSIMAILRELPIIGFMIDMFDISSRLARGEIGWFDAGKALVVAFARGLMSGILFPFKILWKALGWLRRLLPFSDAHEGPLSDLTASGASVLKTFGKGIMSVVGLPARLILGAFRGIMTAIRGLWSGIGSVARGAGNVLTAPFRRIAEGFKSAWSGIGNMAAGSGVVGTLMTPFRLGLQGVGRLLSVTTDNIQRSWSLMRASAGWVARAILSTQEGIGNRLSGVWDSMKQRAAALWSGIGSMAEAGRNGLAAMTSLDGIRGAFAGAKQWLSGSLTLEPRDGAVVDAMDGLVAVLRFVGARLGNALDGNVRPALSGVARTAAAATIVSANIVAPSIGAERAPLRPNAPQLFVSAEKPTESVVSVPDGHPYRDAKPIMPAFVPVQRPMADQRTQERREGSPDMGELFALLREFVHRPIDVTVVSRLDGREVAKSVYRDMREQRVKGYETL